MLEGLCGNKNIQRILIFLFVNGKCYGTQLHRALATALTPIQKALSRLEKGGLITSYYEGKTRLYQFNPSYPLIHEVEQLLKKAYTLLPAHEKKEYYVVKEDLRKLSVPQENTTKILLAFWEKLLGVTQLTFHAKTKSKEENGWNGKGKGEVIITKDGHNRLIFSEKGTWQGIQGGEFSFSNTFRWSIDRNIGVISLEHLRRGPDQPVFLFYLAPSGKHSLSSVDSHLCGGDTYFGQINFDRYTLRLNWRVIGPKKNEEIDYYYS
ncbi:MAG: winged helix-turn-helix transcriptional regulator [Parachlamydiaceae bacterium]|nr:winged helix-turn-helix transcriptional regulator [Parachlamydiaceae bacterium]